MPDSKRIVAPHDFLDRKEERVRLKALVKRKENLLVYGPRRFGKTSLIARIEHDLPSTTFLNVDCTFATSVDGLSQQILRAIADSGLAKLERFGAWAKESARRLEVGVEFGDGVRINLRRGSAQAKPLEDALEFATRIAKASGRHVVLVLDEFQVVMLSMPDAVPKLRGHAQSQSDVSYLVCGSQASVLLGLTKHKNPFWRQLTEFPLGPIDVDHAMDDWAKKVGQEVPPPARQLLTRVTRGNTQRLVGIVEEARRGGKGYGIASIESAIQRELVTHGRGFERILGDLTPYQKTVAIALAIAQPKSVFGSKFLTHFELRGASSARKATQALFHAEILGEDNAFVDPLFAHWIRVNNPDVGTGWIPGQ